MGIVGRDQKLDNIATFGVTSAKLERVGKLLRNYRANVKLRMQKRLDDIKIKEGDLKVTTDRKNLLIEKTRARVLVNELTKDGSLRGSYIPFRVKSKDHELSVCRRFEGRSFETLYRFRKS